MIGSMLLVASVLVLAADLAATPRGEVDAQRVAEVWLSAQGQSAELCQSSTWPIEGEVCLYEFHFSDGAFAFVSADDAARPVLAWGGEGSSSSVHPPAQLHWIQQQAEQVADLRAEGIANAQAHSEWERLLNGAASGSRSGVDALVPVAWGQGEPYNALCPEDDSGPGGRVYVGCVAVAMAQIMAYWMQPVQGVSNHAYFHHRYGEQYADFEHTTYQWEAMQQGNTDAIAELMYHCAVSVEMDFSSEQSGAVVYGNPPSAQTAFTRYFNYGYSVGYTSRTNHTESSWSNLLRGELDQGHPFIYRARNTNGGGHAFVCDGYRDESFFHFNWGWNGANNGYYNISSLDPNGILYNEDHGALVFLEPRNYHLAPQLVYPDQGDVDVPVVSTFEWMSVEGAETYDLQLDLGNDFSSPREYLGIADTSLTLDDLQTHTSYFWRLRVRGEHGLSHWSPAFEFLTECAANVEAPELLSPTDGVTLVALDHLPLHWNPVECARSYDLELDDDADFSSPLVNLNEDTLWYHDLAITLDYDKTYYWRVRSHGASSTGEWSDVFTFSTPVDAAVEVAGPGAFELRACPNPFNPSTQLEIVLHRAAETRVAVYNLSGQQLAVLHDNMLSAGTHRFRWTADASASGLYLAVVESGDTRLVQKLSVMK